MAWIKLTDPDGNPAQLNVDQLVVIRRPVADEVDQRARTLIDLSNGHVQAVLETVDEVVAQLPR